MSWITQNIHEDVANYLFNIRINQLTERIGTFQRDVRPDLRVDFDMLEKQLEETPEMLAFFDMLLADQKSKVALLERRSLMVRGQITQRILDDGHTGAYEVRRSDLEDIIEADDNVIDVETRLIFEQKIENKLKAVVQALQLKAEVLRSLAGFKKIERNETRA